MRVYLTGRIAVEAANGPVVDERLFPSRQARRAFAYLADRRGAPVPRDELAAAVWGDAEPTARDAALSAIVSKLRSFFRRHGLRGCGIDAAYGCYAMRLPQGTWSDVEAAERSVEAAEAHLRAGRTGDAWAEGSVAAAIARRPFLPGEDGEWIEARRGALRAILVRSLDALAEVWTTTGEAPLAVGAAAEVVRLEPFREASHRRLMSAHAAAGNRAEALRTYDRLRRLLREELGADPAPETEAAYVALLRADSSARI